jgi:hypothetical protein
LIEKIDTTPKKLRNFGILFAVVGGLVSAWGAWHGNASWIWWSGGGAFFLLAGLAAPAFLKPLYIAWMSFAFVLGWINTRVILGVFFYCVMTPIGLVLRLTGKDLLDEKIDSTAKSYWKKRERRPVEPGRYERLF